MIVQYFGAFGLNVIVSIGSAFIGAYFGVKLQLRHERRRIQRRNIKLASLIFFELLDNFKEINNHILSDDYHRISLNDERWNMYKSELGTWGTKNVARLYMIYEMINEFNNKRAGFPSPENKQYIINIGGLIKETLIWYMETDRIKDTVSELRKEQMKLIRTYSEKEIKEYGPPVY